MLYRQSDVIGYGAWGSNDKNRHERFVHFQWLPGAIVSEFSSTSRDEFDVSQERTDRPQADREMLPLFGRRSLGRGWSGLPRRVPRGPHYSRHITILTYGPDRAASS